MIGEELKSSDAFDLTFDRIPFGSIDNAVFEHLIAAVLIALHIRVFLDVSESQMSKDIVVRTDRLLAITELIVVVGIIGDNSPAVKVGRKYERDGMNPFADGLSLGLFYATVLLEEVRKVSVQVSIARIVPNGSTIRLALNRSVKKGFCFAFE